MVTRLMRRLVRIFHHLLLGPVLCRRNLQEHLQAMCLASRHLGQAAVSEAVESMIQCWFRAPSEVLPPLALASVRYAVLLRLAETLDYQRHCHHPR